MRGADIRAIDYKTPRKIKDPSAPARVIGRPSTIIVELRGATPDEIKASKDNAAGRIIQAPRGVHRYRSHEDANAQMDQWLARTVQSNQVDHRGDVGWGNAGRSHGHAVFLRYLRWRSLRGDDLEGLSLDH